MLKLTSSLWTITNGLFLWLGAVGVRNCYRESHPTIFLIAYLGYIIVGLGSVSFHATLKCTNGRSLFSYTAGATMANANEMIHRSGATRGWAWYDIYDLFDDLCEFRSLKIPGLCCQVGGWPDDIGRVHHGELCLFSGTTEDILLLMMILAVLSCHKRSGVSPSCLCGSDRYCFDSQYMGYGSTSAALVASRRCCQSSVYTQDHVGIGRYGWDTRLS